MPKGPRDRARSNLRGFVFVFEKQKKRRTDREELEGLRHRDSTSGPLGTARQREFQFRTWGGKRPGAGPKRKLPGKNRLPHVARARIPARLPVHVTMRIAEGVPSLRTRPALQVLLAAFSAARDTLGMRITHFVIESNHLHLIVEGVSGAAMKGLGVRIARRINRLQRREGQVIGDRYDATPLRCPAQVRNAVHYVLYNHKHHTGHGEPDEYTSLLQSHAVVAPRTWLLTHPNGRAGPVRS